MSKDPAVLFYTKDFLTGTSFFSDAERGQYIRLLCEQHQNGHIPENHMLSVCLSLGSPVVKKFIKDNDGFYFNERMEEEIQKRVHFIETRRDNGLKGGRPLKANDKPNALPNEEATEKLIGNGNGIDFDLIIGNYHLLCPKMNKVQKISEDRKKHINARISEFGIEKMTEVFRRAGESDFLNGKNDRVWKADFDWLIKSSNFLKVLEGKYDKAEQIRQLAR